MPHASTTAADAYTLASRLRTAALTRRLQDAQASAAAGDTTAAQALPALAAEHAAAARALPAPRGPQATGVLDLAAAVGVLNA